MWPFNTGSDEPEFHCDGQVAHEYEVLEEMETCYLDRYYDAKEEAEVVVVMTIPKVAECRVCGDQFENEQREWAQHGSFTSFNSYEIEYTKIIVNDCSDAERIDATDEF